MGRRSGETYVQMCFIRVSTLEKNRNGLKILKWNLKIFSLFGEKLDASVTSMIKSFCEKDPSNWNYSIVHQLAKSTFFWALFCFKKGFPYMFHWYYNFELKYTLSDAEVQELHIVPYSVLLREKWASNVVYHFLFDT